MSMRVVAASYAFSSHLLTGLCLAMGTLQNAAPVTNKLMTESVVLWIPLKDARF